MLPTFRRFRIANEDKLRTAVEHIAFQISQEITKLYERQGTPPAPEDKMLITGGGAFNDYLIQRISELASVDVVIPDDNTIKFKEALIMALMGVLRIRNETNCLASVTGASQDCIGGIIYQGIDKKI
jgi:anhydro-N-acetylmuramic acid kinase